MNKTLLARFKKLFEQQKKNLLFNDRIVSDDMDVRSGELLDEVDQASHDIEQSMRIRLRNREVFHMHTVESALRKIEEGTFGECEGCGDDIELKRLQARPTATLCLSCKEEEEKRDMGGVGTRKSTGESAFT